ncbi:MAG: hypothetical protein ABEK01_03295 [Candidatus Nanohaloarchaea archaeon]
MINLSVIFSGLGLLILIVGLYEAVKLRRSLGNLKKTLRPLGSISIGKAWTVLIALIILFIGGYTAFIATILTPKMPIKPELLTALVFFFGAIFVFTAAYSNRKAFSSF